MEKLGNPKVYTTALAREIIKKRQDEFPNAPKINFELVKNRDKIKISDNIEIEFFGIIHSIPDTVSVLIKTPIGNFVYCTDVKFDYDEKGDVLGLDEFEWVSKKTSTLCFWKALTRNLPGYRCRKRRWKKY